MFIANLVGAELSVFFVLFSPGLVKFSSQIAHKPKFALAEMFLEARKIWFMRGRL